MMGNPIAGCPSATSASQFMWEIMNRGKRCIGLDVSHADGQQVLHDLVAGADVFVTNLLPDARRRFRVDTDDLFAVNRASGLRAAPPATATRAPSVTAAATTITDFWARTGIGHAASQVSDEFVPLLGPAFGDLTSGAFLAGGHRRRAVPA